MRLLARLLVLSLAAAATTKQAFAIDETYWKQSSTPWVVESLRRLIKGDESCKSYALVVGVGAYDHYEPLTAPANDAQRVARYLQKTGFDEVRLLTDADATFGKINRLMQRDYPHRVEACDSFLFYFSGHGDTETYASGEKKGYLVLKDAEIGGWDQMIDMSRVTDWSRSLGKARRLLFVLDACFSGLAAFERKSPPPADPTLEARMKRLRQPSAYLLTAGAEGEESFAVDGESLFTNAWLDAVGGDGDRNRDGVVTLSEIKSAVDEALERKRAELGDRIKMSPKKWELRTDNNSGEFFFFTGSAAEPAPVGSDTPGTVEKAEGKGPATFDEREADLRFWESVKDTRKPRDYRAYLSRFPSGIYAELARSRLEDIEPAAATSADPFLVAPATTSLLATAPQASATPEIGAEVAETGLGLSRADWSTIQRALTFLGHDAGPADGKPGPRTREAIAKWQAANGHTITEYLAVGQIEELRNALPQSGEPSGVTRTLQPGDVFVDTLKDGRSCSFCPEMVVIPAGSFTMGSPPSEAGHDESEAPQHRVTLAKPFAIGRYELTFEEWDACVAAGGCNDYSPADQGWGRNRRPVINVSWSDAQAYVSWLSRRTGQTYRLPTEAEWEYSARAGTQTPFWTGAVISTAQANYDGSFVYGNGSEGVSREQTIAVDDQSFGANPFGLFHVHGNVWEWVEDCYFDDYSGALRNGSPRLMDKCTAHVLRGGSWYHSPANLRSAFRSRLPPDSRYSDAGFRVARRLSP